MEEDVWNQDTHSRHQIKVAIAKLAIASGFQTMHQQPLNCLADIMERYMHAIGTRAMEFAEHANHNEANFLDVFAALGDMGTQPHFLRNLIDFTDPMTPTEVPKYPKFETRIKGLNFSGEIDDNLPDFVYPWMPSIKATNMRHECAEKAKEVQKEEVQSSEGEDEAPSAPPSAPGGARGADQYFPEQPDSADESSCPPTPMTPAVPPTQCEPKSAEKPKPESVKRNIPFSLAGIGDLSDSSNSPPSTKSVQIAPKPVSSQPIKSVPSQSKPVSTTQKPVPNPKPTQIPKPTPEKESASKSGEKSKLDQLDDLGLFKISPQIPKREKHQEKIPSPSKVVMPTLDEPPGLSDSDDELDAPLDEPPGYSSSSNDSDDGGLSSSFGSNKVPPSASSEILPVLPKPTSPKPVSPSAEFPTDVQPESEAERKRRKIERKKKKKEKKEKKRMEKEKKKKEKKEKKKEKKEKKKKEKNDSDSDSGKSDSESHKKDSELKVKISLKPPTGSADGKKKRGRPPTKKSPKPKKPRGRPPKDPDRAAEKQRQLDIERGIISPNKSKENQEARKPASPLPPMDSRILSSSSESSDDEIFDKPPVVKIPPPPAPVVKVEPPKPPAQPEKIEKPEIPKPKSKNNPIVKNPPLDDLFKPDTISKHKTVQKPQPKAVRKRSRSRSPEKIVKKKPEIKPDPSPPEKIKKHQNPPKKPKIERKEEKIKKNLPEIKPPVTKVLDQQRKQKKLIEQTKPIDPLVIRIHLDGNWNVSSKVESKPSKPSSSSKKEPSKKPIAQKEPSKLLKKTEAPPTVQVAASTTLPPIESGSKNTYLVLEGGEQKVVDYGDEVWICPTCSRQDDGSPMIGCDNCDDWYHNACLNILTVPTGKWYCPKCEKKKNDQPKKKKKRK